MSCTWTFDETVSAWDTQCGATHGFVDGGPKENHHKWCPYCGEPLVDVVPVEHQEGDAP